LQTESRLVERNLSFEEVAVLNLVNSRTAYVYHDSHDQIQR
jgi:hypothetical protein